MVKKASAKKKAPASRKKAAPKEPSLETMRDDLLRATLPHVPFDGWTKAALLRGASEAGYASTDAMRAFPDGARDMIPWHARHADRMMMQQLEKLDLPSMRIRDRIATAVRVRLEQNAGDKEAIRRAMTFLAMPQNAALATQSLYRTVDDMWFAAGDTATDWNFYTKRLLLAGVYSSTLLYWLNDRSEDHADTWAFLDRRIENVMQVPKLTGRVSGMLEKCAGFLPRQARAFRDFRPRSG
ncbi:MAG: COQ9 family protein [Alphaproteobacteria bacterium]